MCYFVQQVFALCLLALFLPLLCLISLLCLVFQGLPVLYREERLGMHRRKFIIIKFRTMYGGNHVYDAGSMANIGSRYNKKQKDARITFLGYFLRRFSMDELPQLWNIAKGDMALVGPRPVTEEEEILYGKYSARLHSVKPGLTGLWQVSGRNELSYHQRIGLNLYYVRHRSWKLDMYILLKTVWAVIAGRGAY